LSPGPRDSANIFQAGAGEVTNQVKNIFSGNNQTVIIPAMDQDIWEPMKDIQPGCGISQFNVPFPMGIKEFG